MLNSSVCNFCKIYEQCLASCTPPCATGNTVSTQPTDVQQLKAKIAALASEIENDISTGAKPYNHSRIVTILRQLSDVQ
jgi:hypothetical protein